MKKIIISALALAIAASASAFDPKDLLGKLKGDTTSTTSSSSSDDTNSGGILGAIGGLIINVTANNKFSVDDIVGTWNYTSPAVSFESDNALMKIGGAGAATAVEEKLSPYYNQLGFNKTVLTVEADHSFTMKLGLLSLKGTIEKDETDNGLVFNFSAFGKISLGQVKAHATKSGSTLNLTFDATRLIEILTKISSTLNISTLKTVTSLLDNYDGIYMGFKLKKA